MAPTHQAVGSDSDVQDAAMILSFVGYVIVGLVKLFETCRACNIRYTFLHDLHGILSPNSHLTVPGVAVKT